MIFLPIVERELRLAARRRGTYWSRLVVGLIAILTGAVIFLLSLDAPQQKVGQYLFIGLAILCLIYCVVAGRLSTADSLSEEKREGTLGLLFLTDLKGYDIVFGKLAASSLGAFYGMLPVLPVLAIPLLLGGITNGEFWRVVLILVDTLFLSLAIGMLGSAMTRDARRAMAANFGLMLFFLIVLPGGAAAVTYFWGAFLFESLLSCPIYSFYLCEDANYRSGSAHFWWSVGIIHALAWLMLAFASWIVPRTWQDKPAPPKRTTKIRLRDLWRALSYGRPAKSAPFRKRLLDVNAFYWLMARARLKPLHVWVFLVCMAAWWIVNCLAADLAWYDPLVGVTLALVLNSTLKAWVAIEAGQQLADDQRTGALELVLSTPLSVQDILRGQWLALRRQFLKPLLLAILFELIFMFAEIRHLRSGDTWQLVSFWIAGMAMLVADILTLRVVALRVALTSKSPNKATVTTMSRVLFLPWVLFGIGAGLVNLWVALFSDGGTDPGWWTYLSLWFVAGIGVDLLLGLRARWQLQHRFRQLGIQRFSPAPTRAERKLARKQPQPGASPSSGATIPAPAPITKPASGLSTPRLADSKSTSAAPPSAAPQKATEPPRLAPEPPPSRPRKRKRLALGFSLLVPIAAAWLYYDSSRPPKFPPPLVISITQSNGPLRVYPGSSVALILPDGSLWRWGGTGWGQIAWAIVPEQVGTNRDWVETSGMGHPFVGLRQDGSIWQWGYTNPTRPGHYTVDPEMPDPGRDWVAISAGNMHCVALKKDGTLWTWGDNSRGMLGIGAGLTATNPVQIGTNQDWVAAACVGTYSVGMRKDGSLWVWGTVYSRGTGFPVPNPYQLPTQICTDTNWTAMQQGIFAWNSAGEVRHLLTAAANPEAPASQSCALLSTNSLPGHLISAINGDPMLYELRPNGSLWEKSDPISYPGWSPPAKNDWHRFGKRNDWVGLWSAYGTALGLTADGTVWVWGVDPGREPKRTVATRFAILKTRLGEIFGRRLPPGARISSTAPSIQNEPRPILRLQFTNPAPPTSSGR